jgi:hypothetical protein
MDSKCIGSAAAEDAKRTKASSGFFIIQKPFTRPAVRCTAERESACFAAMMQAIAKQAKLGSLHPTAVDHFFG